MRDESSGSGSGERDETPGDETEIDGGPGPEELRNRLEQLLGGRPLMVYLVLFAGAAALLLLLVIVWISATGGDDEDAPVCLDIPASETQELIRVGQVERLDIIADREQPEAGPVAIRIKLINDTCRNLPQGATNQATLYQIIGLVEFYNTYGEQRVRVHNERVEIPRELLVTATPEPTVTPTLPPASPTLMPVAPATETPIPEPTATLPPPTETPPPATATALPGTPTPTVATPQEQPAP